MTKAQEFTFSVTRTRQKIVVIRDNWSPGEYLDVSDCPEDFLDFLSLKLDAYSAYRNAHKRLLKLFKRSAR